MSAAPAPAAPEASPVLFAQSGLLRPWQLAVALLALAGSLLLAATLNNYYVFVLASVALLALVGIGLNVLIGLSGQVSFGHVGFYALGAYAVAILTTRAGLGFWAAWSLAAAGCALVGALLAIPALRVKGPYLAMVTIAFGFIVEHATVEMSGLTGGQNGIMGIAGPLFGTLLSGERAVAALAIVATALALVAYALLARGNWGTALLAGLAGGLYTPLSGFVTPGSFGFIQPILFVLVVMIGGAGTLLGPLLGALIVGIPPELLARFENVCLLIFGALLLVVLWSAPNGVVGLLMQCWSAVRRRFAGGVLAPEFAVPVPDLERRLRRTLRAEALSMQFGGVRAVSELSFSVAPAAITSLIGPNGAGKSTVINMLSGFYVPSAGRIFLDDVALHGKSAHAIERTGIARTYQTSQLFGSLSVLDNVALALPRGELGALLSDYQIRSHKARWRAARLLRWCGYAGRLQQAAGRRPLARRQGAPRRAAAAHRRRRHRRRPRRARHGAGHGHLRPGRRHRRRRLSGQWKLRRGAERRGRAEGVSRRERDGAEPVLHAVDLVVRGGHTVALLGANGAGKTTLMRSLVGLHRPLQGQIRLAETEISVLAAEHIVGLGLVLVPEGRQVFPELSVLDNMRLGAFLHPAGREARVEEMLVRFPRLRERLQLRAGLLSGGEQQMLAIARALMARPRVLILDEPSLGLAPKVIEESFQALRRLRDEGMTLVVVDQMAALAQAYLGGH